ncbi:hypothetical protein ACHHYP_07638 [Achlya hypogyna]|uniref:UVR domain-containing protein n=1 Tax=Achlya hypogyna TaxID=1202772 RepID=A0A1V9YQK9_ACHHY|nr:hypothetical protein ACHHYP_07638 [Achlya hypogyna]
MLGRLFNKKDEAAKSTRPPSSLNAPAGRPAGGDTAGGGFFNLPPPVAKGVGNPAAMPASYSTSPSTSQAQPMYGSSPQQQPSGHPPSLLSYPRHNAPTTSPSPAPAPSLFGGMSVKQADATGAPMEAPKPTSLFVGLDLGGSVAPANTTAPLSLGQMNLGASSTPSMPATVEPPVQKPRPPRQGTFNYMNVVPVAPTTDAPVAAALPQPAPIKRRKKPTFRPGFDRQSSEDAVLTRSDDHSADDASRQPRANSVLKDLTVHHVQPEVGRAPSRAGSRTGTTPTRATTTSRTSSSASDSLTGLLDQLQIVNVGPGAAGFAMPPPVATMAPITTPSTIPPAVAATPRKSLPSPRPMPEPPAKALSRAPSVSVTAPPTPEGRLVQLIRDYDTTAKSFRDAMVQLAQEDARLAEKKTALSRQLALYALDLQSVEAQQLQAAEDEDFERADALNTTIGSVRHCIMLAQSDLRKSESDLAGVVKQREKLMVHHVRTTKGVLNAIQKCEDDRLAAYSELSAAAKAYQQTERRRFAFEQQRIATELHHVTVNMGHLEGEKAEIETSIASQCTAETEARTRLLAEKAQVESDIAELEAKLAAARATVATIDDGLAEADAGIQAVRHKFARQLKRLVEREKGILKTKKEIEADDLALGRQQDAFAAKKAAFSADLAQAAKDILGVQKEVRVASIMARLTDEQNARREARDDRVKKQDAQLAALREAAQQAEQQYKLLGHQLEELKKKLQTNRTVIMTAGTTMPALEAEKKAAAAERNFKEAARLSKDIKQLEKDRATAEEQIEVLGMEIKDIEERIHVREDEFHAKQDELRDVEKNLDLAWLDVLYQVHVDLRVAQRQLAKYESHKWSGGDGDAVDFRGVALTLVQMEFSAVVTEIEALEDKHNLEPHVAELPPEVPEKELALLVEATDDDRDDDSAVEAPTAVVPLARSVSVVSSVATVGDLTTSDAIKEKIGAIEAQIDEATENEDYELAARLDDELEEWTARLTLVEAKEGELQETLTANDMHKQVEALQHKIEQLAEQIEKATAEEEYELAAALDEELVAAQTQKTDLQLTLANLPNDHELTHRLSVQSLHLVEDNSDAEEDDDDAAHSTDDVTAEEAPKAPVATPATEAPVVEAPVADAPVAEASTEEAPVVEAPVAAAPSLFGGLSIAPAVATEAPVAPSLFGGLSLAPSTPLEPATVPIGGSLFGGLQLGSAVESTPAGGSLFGGLVIAAPATAPEDAGERETDEDDDEGPSDDGLLGGGYVMPQEAPRDDGLDTDNDDAIDEYMAQADTPVSSAEELYMAQADTPVSTADELYMAQADTPVAATEVLSMIPTDAPLVTTAEPSVAPTDAPVVTEELLSTLTEPTVTAAEPSVAPTEAAASAIEEAFAVPAIDAPVVSLEDMPVAPADSPVQAAEPEVAAAPEPIIAEAVPAVVAEAHDSAEDVFEDAITGDEHHASPTATDVLPPATDVLPPATDVLPPATDALTLADAEVSPVVAPIAEVQALVTEPTALVAEPSLFGGLSVAAPAESSLAGAPSLFGGLSVSQAVPTADATSAPLSLFGGLSVAPTAPVEGSLFGGLDVKPKESENP